MRISGVVFGNDIRRINAGLIFRDRTCIIREMQECRGFGNIRHGNHKFRVTPRVRRCGINTQQADPEFLFLLVIRLYSPAEFQHIPVNHEISAVNARHRLREQFVAMRSLVQDCHIVIADAVSKKVIFPSRTCGGKKHDRIGGVAIYPGFFLPFVSVLFYSAQILDLLTLDKQMVHLILGASTVFGLGVIDDVRRAGTQAEICGSDCRRSGRILRSVPPPFSRVCTG